MFLKPNSKFESMSLESILSERGLDFQPLKVDSFVRSPISGAEINTGESSIMRSDNDGIIANVGEKYHLVPYAELFSRFDSDLRHNGFNPCGCESFNGGGGARIFYVKRDNGNFGIGTRLPVFSLRTSINGRWPTSFGGYMFEAVCLNGMSRELWAEESEGVRHTKTHDSRLTSAIVRFNWIGADMVKLGETLNQWSQKRAIASILEKFTLAILPDTSEENKARKNQRDVLTLHVQAQAELRGRAVTFEDLLQGVTAYNSHEKAKTAESVFERILTGKGVERVETAMNWIAENV